MNEKSMITLFNHILKKCPDAVRIEISSEALIVERQNAYAPVEQSSALPVTGSSVVTDTPAASQGEEGNPIKSPIVGTFYAAPSPDDPPFVKPGQRVKKGQVLCIIEAMKTMNEIESDHNGTVTQVLAKNGDLVEFGQVLFVIE
ncbi:MAG: acetyl-CoA carboxylase biotin carboxyl carrier protein [Oscillospiraceae bacterium]|nr:acetyl-CoA carboxylase biotin carboxyl carrier protein [Oscillospiraceae bacterium]